jgi:hypothetical protein
MSSGIYQIRNLLNGHKYVGRSRSFSGRQRKHWRLLAAGKHHSQHLQAAWNKYGAENFVFEPVYLSTDPKDTVIGEQLLIDLGVGQYNVSTSAQAPDMTPELRKKLSDALKGRIFTPEHRQRIGEARKGRKFGPASEGRKAKQSASWTPARRAAAATCRAEQNRSVESRARSSATHSGKPDPALAERNRARTGWKMSAESRAKLSASRAGKPQSAIHVARKAAAKKETARICRVHQALHQGVV